MDSGLWTMDYGLWTLDYGPWTIVFSLAFVAVPSFLASSMKKTILLFLISLASLFLFFLVPDNGEWLQKRVINYWFDFRRNRDKTDPEFRKISRWESDYVIAKQVADHFPKDSQYNNILVLMPPSKYFAENKINFHVPEPAVFYYYTGLKTTWINSKKAMQANWMVVAVKTHIEYLQVKNKQMLADSIASFKKYPVNL